MPNNDREPGFYWVKCDKSSPNCEWEPARLLRGGLWSRLTDKSMWFASAMDEIGPRILPPDFVPTINADGKANKRTIAELHAASLARNPRFKFEVCTGSVSNAGGAVQTFDVSCSMDYGSAMVMRLGKPGEDLYEMQKATAILIAAYFESWKPIPPDPKAPE